MLSQGANYMAAFMVGEKTKHFCPLLDASLMMLWHDMAYVEMYVSQDFKKELYMYYAYDNILSHQLRIYHFRNVKYNNFMYVLFYFLQEIIFLSL